MKQLKENIQYIKDTYLSDNVLLTFLHVPYYSISIWNKTKGHKNPEKFPCDDNTLTERIDSVNDYIDNLNSEINSHSPKFNQDLVRSRKPHGSGQRYSLNLKLLSDGIHPGKTLAQAWLTSLTKNINTDCV